MKLFRFVVIKRALFCRIAVADVASFGAFANTSKALLK